jgi:exodeoxyribonuclease-3
MKLCFGWPDICRFFCRIDDHLATPAPAATAKAESIYLAQRFSDHAPLIIDLDLDL